MEKRIVRIIAVLLACLIVTGSLAACSNQHDTYALSDRSSPKSEATGIHRDKPIAITYIGNSSTKKFHKPTCSYLPDQTNQVTFNTREKAIAAGYEPCGHCHP